jgi:hypothetical protein
MSNRVQSLSVVLAGICRQLGMQGQMALYQIQAHWGEIVGPQISTHSAPEAIRFRALSLGVDSAPWMNQLLFFKRKIVEKTNQFIVMHDLQIPPIEDLHLKVVSLGLSNKAQSTAAQPAFPLPISPSSIGSGALLKNTMPSLEAAIAIEETESFCDEALKEVVRKACFSYFRKIPTTARKTGRLMIE